LENKRQNLTLSIQVLYGVGVSYAIVDQIFAQWVMTYYLPPERFSFSPFLSPLFIALALIISRFVDMVSDPLIGFWSDRLETRWGRRIPFMFIGAIPLALSTIAFFYPPKGGGASSFLYLALIGSIFFIFYTIVGAPYNALIPELSHSQKDRLNLSTWQSVFRLIYTAVAMVLPGILISALGGGDDEKGLRLMVVFLSLMAAAGIFVTCFTIDEKKYSGGKKSETDLKTSLKIIIANKAFMIYLGGFLLFFIGFNNLRASINYFVIDIMLLQPGAITIVSALLFGVAALFFYPINKLASRISYRKPMLISLVLLAAASGALFFVGRGLPLWSGYFIYGFCGIPVAGAAFIFPPAMLSEISAVATKKTTVQIEGLFFGIQGFVLKLAFLISIALLPILLVSGSGLSFVDMLTTIPEGPDSIGIYRTAAASSLFFILSFFFYFFFPEEVVRDE
jgi:GPH family glycoside/pentoside/hexuronide:cation symporter